MSRPDEALRRENEQLRDALRRMARRSSAFRRNFIIVARALTAPQETAPESPAADRPGVTTPADPAQAAHGDAGGQESGSGANDTRVVRPGHTLIVAESGATTWEPKLRCDGTPGDLQRDCTAWIPCGCDWHHRADPCPVSPTGQHLVLLDGEPMRPTGLCLLETETAAHAAAVDLVSHLRLAPGSYPVAWVGDEYGYVLRLVGGES